MYYIRTILVFSILILLYTQSAAQSSGKSDPVAGGACLYKIYPGLATIASIAPLNDHSTNDNGRFEVRFSFQPNNKIKENFARVEGKTFLLYDQHLRYPDAAFINKHNIQVGQTLPGDLKTITRGTCTPVVFDFPGLKERK